MDGRPYNYDDFETALKGLIAEREGKPVRRAKLKPTLDRVEGWEYETLRQQIVGDLTLKREAIEAIAAVVEVRPDYFMAYRIHRVAERLKHDPHLVDAAYQWVLDKEAESVPAHGSDNASGGDE